MKIVPIIIKAMWGNIKIVLGSMIVILLVTSLKHFLVMSYNLQGMEGIIALIVAKSKWRRDCFLLFSDYVSSISFFFFFPLFDGRFWQGRIWSVIAGVHPTAEIAGGRRRRWRERREMIPREIGIGNTMTMMTKHPWRSRELDVVLLRGRE